jgi:hypothetical protein
MVCPNHSTAPIASMHECVANKRFMKTVRLAKYVLVPDQSFSVGMDYNVGEGVKCVLPRTVNLFWAPRYSLN